MTPLQNLTPDQRRRLYIAVGWRIGIPVALVALIPALVAIFLSNHNATVGRDNLCSEISDLRTQNREEARGDYAQEAAAAKRAFRDLDHNLTLLHLKKTTELIQAAEDARDTRIAGAAARRDRRVNANPPKEC